MCHKKHGPSTLLTSHVSNVKFLMTGGLTEMQNNCFVWVATLKPTAFRKTTEGSINQAARP